jgi:alpha-tubulin suppressor-like RCC1 family protein
MRCRLRCTVSSEDQRTPKVIEALRGEKVVAVSAGENHSLVLTEAGAVLSFGLGDDGCLGHGDEEHQRTPKVIEALRSERVVAVAGGETSTASVCCRTAACSGGVSARTRRSACSSRTTS